MSRLRRSRQHGVSILSAYLVHPFASSRHFPSRGNENVTGLAFCVIWHDKHSGDWLTAFAPLSGCAGLLHGKACHTILRSLCFLTNRVPLPPLFRGQNKTPRNTLFISISTVSTGCCAPPRRGGKVVAPATKGGMYFLDRSEAGLFSPAYRAVVWFSPPKAV